MIKYTVSHPATLLETLEILSPGSSKSTLRSWLKEGRVNVDGKTVTNGTLSLKEGEVIVIGSRKRMIGGGIQILFEDSHLVVIEKPNGLLSVATAFEKGETAHALLKAHYRPRKVFVVHRLDQETSGVMLFALSEEAFIKFKKLFEKHQLERSYTAIVEGKMESSNGSWQSYLIEDDNYVVHITKDSERGQLATTHYQVKQSSSRYTWIEATLETGKKNQIRAHCQAAGHSIAGDKKYGATTNPIKRLCLHAHLLAFEHPITHKKMRFESEPPQEFLKFLK